MSLTEGHEIFAGVSEEGVNDFVGAFFGARPRHLTYGSPAFVPATTVFETQIPAISFPGVPGGIQYHVTFSVPKVDFHPDDSGGPLPPGLNQFTLYTSVRLTVGCRGRRRGDDANNPDRLPTIEPVTTGLEIIARGSPVVRYFGPGTGEVGLNVTEVEIVDVKPDSLESVLECLLRMMLQAAVGNLILPFEVFQFDAFQLALAQGPEIEEDQVQVYGNV